MKKLISKALVVGFALSFVAPAAFAEKKAGLQEQTSCPSPFDGLKAAGGSGNTNPPPNPPPVKPGSVAADGTVRP
jgi:hypothetical protein